MSSAFFSLLRATGKLWQPPSHPPSPFSTRTGCSAFPPSKALFWTSSVLSVTISALLIISCLQSHDLLHQYQTTKAWTFFLNSVMSPFSCPGWFSLVFCLRFKAFIQKSWLPTWPILFWCPFCSSLKTPRNYLTLAFSVPSLLLSSAKLLVSRIPTLVFTATLWSRQFRNNTADFSLLC